MESVGVGDPLPSSRPGSDLPVVMAPVGCSRPSPSIEPRSTYNKSGPAAFPRLLRGQARRPRFAGILCEDAIRTAAELRRQDAASKTAFPRGAWERVLNAPQGMTRHRLTVATDSTRPRIDQRTMGENLLITCQGRWGAAVPSTARNRAAAAPDPIHPVVPEPATGLSTSFPPAAKGRCTRLSSLVSLSCSSAVAVVHGGVPALR